MLTASFIRANTNKVITGLQKRGYDQEQIGQINLILNLDNHRKETQTDLDRLLAQLNIMSKKVGSLYQQGDIKGAQKIKDDVSVLKKKSKSSKEELTSTLSRLEDLLLSIPNIPHDKVPFGNTNDDNEMVQDWNQPLPALYKDHIPHWELAKKYNLIDFELGTKITGPGFPLYRGKGAKFQRSLISFFLDEATKAGYEEVLPPYLVNRHSARATGNLPDKEGQMYFIQDDQLYLIPTAEVPITNIFRDVVIPEKELPQKLTAYTPCFRREAGSYGSDVKGLNRIHQFDKVEILQITKKENSYEVLDDMLSHVKSLLVKLKLPYRILRLCAGDLGFTSALTYDFEVFSGAQKKWLEVSSVSNFETYQSNRLKLRYSDSTGEKHMAHTLNGSALALARIVAAILENNQSPEGIVIPEVLVPYTGFELIN